MTILRRDPYIWIHLAGLATVPLWLDLCLSGLAVGDPVVPPWVELTTLGLVGTLPILWMQLRRPFYIFSIPGLAVRPDKLGEDRRRLLMQQRTWFSRVLVCLSAIALFFALYWLYQLAPIAADMTPFAAKSRSTGWLICAGSFLFANLFVQVPATVIPLLLVPPQTLSQTRPYEPAEILQHFMVIGLRLPAILPDLDDAPAAQPAPLSSDPQSRVTSSWAESSIEALDAPNEISEGAIADASDAAIDMAELEDWEIKASEAIAPPDEVADVIGQLSVQAAEPLPTSIPHSLDQANSETPVTTELVDATQEDETAFEPAKVERIVANTEESTSLHSSMHAVPTSTSSSAAPTETVESITLQSFHTVAKEEVTDTVVSLSEILEEELEAGHRTSADAPQERNGKTADALTHTTASSGLKEDDRGQIT